MFGAAAGGQNVVTRQGIPSNAMLHLVGSEKLGANMPDNERCPILFDLDPASTEEEHWVSSPAITANEEDQGPQKAEDDMLGEGGMPDVPY